MEFNVLINNISINCQINSEITQTENDSLYKISQDFINDYCHSFHNSHIHLLNGKYDIRSKNLTINDVLFKKIVTTLTVNKKIKVEFKEIIINKTSEDIFFNSGTQIKLEIEIDSNNKVSFVPKQKSIHSPKVELKKGSKSYIIFLTLP